MSNYAGQTAGSEIPNRTSRRASKTLYIVGLIAIFVCVYSQYVAQYVGFHFGLILGALIVYGVPILIVTLLRGTAIVKRFFNNTYAALKLGLGFFGAFTVLGIIVGALILFFLMLINPATVNVLNKPNPVLNVSPQSAWIMVVVSFLIVGPAEEYLFRGFMFGALVEIFNDQHWLSLAFASSVLFAAVHLYYAVTYGLASLIQFTELITFGLAMSSTYYLSKGNLLVPSLIHGAFDATAFIGVAVSIDVGTRLREYMILIGVIVGLVLLIQRSRMRDYNSSGVSMKPSVPSAN
jgi:membrane protease YdiL (CAAX protease family)